LFKWIKQHLRIKAFYGTSENAVKTQIWIAVSMYVLVAIVRKRLGLEASLYQILQILSLTLFEKTPILCALQAIDQDANFAENVNQLILFDFYRTAVIRSHQSQSEPMITSVAVDHWPCCTGAGNTPPTDGAPPGTDISPPPTND
jgi:hypothetical protein